MGIGNELFDQIGPDIAVFCAGVGTAGMLMGVSRAFESARGTDENRGSGTKLVSGPYFRQRRTDRVEGIAAGFRPPHLKDRQYDEVRTVDEQEALAMARRLAREEGIFAGTSSGLNVVAALQLAREIGRGKTVTTVAVDSGLKYLAGDLYET